MRVALITGGAGAVGSATAQMLAHDGFSLVLADLDAERAEAVADDIRREAATEAVALGLDIAAPDAAARLIASVSERFGRLDCLVNNAGRTGASRIDALDPGEWEAVLRVNLTAPMLLWYNKLYAAERGHWRASPLLADQVGLPPTMVVGASLDPLIDQSRAYAAATIAAGVPTVYREAAGNIHGFLNLRRAIPSSVEDVNGMLVALNAMIAEARRQ